MNIRIREESRDATLQCIKYSRLVEIFERCSTRNGKWLNVAEDG